MGKPRASNAPLGPRKPTPKRFYRGLLMPPVEHPAGAAIEALDLPRNPRSRRMALWVVVAAGVVVFSALVTLGLFGQRKHTHTSTQPCRPTPSANPTK